MLHAVRLYFASLVQVVSNVGKSVDAFRGSGPWKKRKRTPRGVLKRECWCIYTSRSVYRAFQILRRLRSTPNILVFKHSPSIVDWHSLNYLASSLCPLHQYKRNSDRQDFAQVARYHSPTTIFSPLIPSARISRRPRTHTHASHA